MKTLKTEEPPDFSLVLGGPLFHLYRRSHLAGTMLELVRRRVLVITLITWLPLLFLSVLDGHAFRGALKVPFLYDIEAHVRFLIGLPLLIAAEVEVHLRVSPLVRRFVERQIVVAEDIPRFNGAVESALRVRNSITLEATLLVFVYVVGLWVWRNHVALGQPTWYANPDSTGSHLTLAGYWYNFVSIPIFQFILLRWCLRFVLWFWLLWQISRLNLHLTAAHPDRSGGLGFLGKSSYAFAPILFAQGAVLSGVIASRILYEGRSLLSFKLEIAGMVVLFVFFMLGPLVMFTPYLLDAKRKGLAEYGLLANRYIFGFEEKWTQGATPDTHELLGTSDLQSLADLGNSYAFVRDMRLVPFGPDDVSRLAAATVIPLLPLTLTAFSAEELLTRIVKMLL